MANHDTYCIITATKHAFSAKWDIVADFGQLVGPSEISEKLATFISEVDALNYMAEKGWELATSYSNQAMSETRHLLRKKA